MEPWHGARHGITSQNRRGSARKGTVWPPKETLSRQTRRRRSRLSPLWARQSRSTSRQSRRQRGGDIAGAKALIESGNKDFNEGHTAHLSLLQQSAIDNKNVTFSLILVHAEDQLMQAESFRIIAEDFIDVYEKLNAKG